MRVAGRPRVPEFQPQVVVDLLETDLVAENVLVEVAHDCVAVDVLEIERLPGALPPISQGPDDGPGTRVRPAFMDLVDRHIREQGRVRRHPAGSQPSRGRHEQPVIGARYHAHEERAHLVHVPDRVVTLSAEVHEFAADAGAAALIDSQDGTQDQSSGYSMRIRVPKRPASMYPRSFGPDSTTSEPMKFSRNSLPSLSQ